MSSREEQMPFVVGGEKNERKGIGMSYLSCMFLMCSLIFAVKEKGKVNEDI